ncbi:MlaD family protein [Acidocella sp.]|uniref:MlaD family protein n=1 Tax=Acidocella sp. TaxID=50710 RepID=UPI003CFF1FEA
MELNAASFRVGAFVLAGIACLVALFLFLSGGLFQGGTLYESYFSESVQGLSVGTAVKYRGVPVGNVTYLGLAAMDYAPDIRSIENDHQYRQIVVRFRLNFKKVGEVDIEKAVRAGLRAQIKPQGITGLSYIDLSFVNPKTYPPEAVPWHPDDPVIPAIPSTLTQVQDVAEKIFSSLGQVDIAKMSDNLSQLLATLNDEVSSGDAHKALANADELLSTLNQALKQSNLPATTASIRNLAGGKQTEQILAQLNQTTAQLAKISSQLPALLSASQAAVNQASETTADVQGQLLPILQSMKATMDNLRDFSSTLSTNPSQVIWGAPPPPPAQEGSK